MSTCDGVLVRYVKRDTLATDHMLIARLSTRVNVLSLWSEVGDCGKKRNEMRMDQKTRKTRRRRQSANREHTKKRVQLMEVAKSFQTKLTLQQHTNFVTISTSNSKRRVLYSLSTQISRGVPPGSGKCLRSVRCRDTCRA